MTDILNSWKTLNTGIKEVNTEEELIELMKYEIITKNRANIMKRLHQKFTKLRTARELFEFTLGITSSIDRH